MEEVEIRNWKTGEVIVAGMHVNVRECLEKNIETPFQGADLRRADLRRANLRGVNLREANLWGANLQETDLREADLQGADLRGADLREADLRGANLRGVNLRGANSLPQLYSLKLQPLKTKLRFWKYLISGKSPYQGFEYEAGKEYFFEDCDSNEGRECGKGGNVATLMWCLQDNSSDEIELIEVEFTAKDIIAIPFQTDGKFRVRKFKVLRKISRAEGKRILNEAMRLKTKEERNEK